MKFLLLSGEPPDAVEPNTCEENYIEKYQLNADFQHWAKWPSWTYVEAAVLFAGICPTQLLSIDAGAIERIPEYKGHLDTGIKNSWPRFKKLVDEFAILNRGVLDGTIDRDNAAPAYWFVTASKLEIAVPWDLWEESVNFDRRTAENQKAVQAAVKEIEQQRQALFGKPPQSDMQRYLIEVTEHEPEIKAGKLLRRMRKELPDCINKIHVPNEKRVKTWEVEYTTDSGDEKRIDYYAFNSALNRAKDKHKKKS